MLMLAAGQNDQAVKQAAMLGGPKSAAAESTLIAMGGEAIPAVLTILKSGQTVESRIRAAHVLAEIDDMKVAMPLAEAAAAGPDELTDAAVVALCRLHRVKQRSAHAEPIYTEGLIEPFELVGARALNGLLMAVKHPDKDVRQTAIALLGSHEDPRMIAPLIELVDGDELWVLSDAASILSRFDDPRVIPALVRNAKKTIPAYSPPPCVAALAYMRERARKEIDEICRNDDDITAYLLQKKELQMWPELFDDNIRLLSSKVAFNRQIGFMALWAAKRPEAIPFLVECLNSEDRSVRRHALNALSAFENRVALEPVKQLFDREKDPQVKSEALDAFAGLDDGRYRPLFLKLLKEDLSYEERKACFTGLSRSPQQTDLVLLKTFLSDEELARDWAASLWLGNILARYKDDAVSLVIEMLKEGPILASGAFDSMELFWSPKYVEPFSSYIRETNSFADLLPLIESREHEELDEAIVGRFLADPEPDYFLVEAAAVIADPKTEQKLIAMTRRADKPSEIWKALVKFNSPEARARILERLVADPEDGSFEVSAAQAAGDLRDPMFEGSLLKLLAASKQGWASIEVVKALGKTGTEKSLPALRAIARKFYESETFMWEAAEAIKQIEARAAQS